MNLLLRTPSDAWAPKERIAATVHLVEGPPLDGRFFLMSRAPHHDGPETPLELLNRSAAFVPFERPDTSVVFLPRHAITRVACAAAAFRPDPDRRSAALDVELVVEGLGGWTLRGHAEVELPPDRARALDYLNTAGPFFALRSDDTIWFVHTAQVLLVRPLD